MNMEYTYCEVMMHKGPGLGEIRHQKANTVRVGNTGSLLLGGTRFGTRQL